MHIIVLIAIAIIIGSYFAVKQTIEKIKTDLKAEIEDEIKKEVKKEIKNYLYNNNTFYDTYDENK
ncbi:MAG: hypothetical protein IK005_08530 [Paludibacteraceae bacterium]|nr:hypothetical protein [Paludibacteraceae bacterium]MBR4840510.1 hypothetical protein [Paludibacteraceae bacterium]